MNEISDGSRISQKEMRQPQRGAPNFNLALFFPKMKMEEFEPGGTRVSHAPSPILDPLLIDLWGVNFFCNIFVGSLVLWGYVSNFVTATTTKTQILFCDINEF